MENTGYGGYTVEHGGLEWNVVRRGSSAKLHLEGVESSPTGIRIIYTNERVRWFTDNQNVVRYDPGGVAVTV